jgi:hypothetical protein
MRQTLWVKQGATEYEAICRACAGDLADGRVFSLAAHKVRVAGPLPETTAAAFATCGRGHRIVVRRHPLARLAQAS